MIQLSPQQLATIFGILGNIVSFMVFLAPVSTFYRIFKKKSTEGFQSIPYLVALFSCSLLLYYGMLKSSGGLMIITINSIGLAIEAAYIAIYLRYAPTSVRTDTTRLLLGFNFAIYGALTVSTFIIFHGALREQIVGWICAIFSVMVFAAPLSVMRLVIKTKSVEYMPFTLSFSLTICAVMWFFYGMLIKDYYIALPNVLGFLFGIAQMILYGIYYRSSKKIKPDEKASKTSSSTDIELANSKDNNSVTEKPQKPVAPVSKSPEHVITVIEEADEDIIEEIEEDDYRARPKVGEPERLVDFHQPIPIMVGV